MRVRREEAGDRAAVERVHRAAFGRAAEAELDRRLHDGPWWLPALSLVATDASGAVVGHVIATRAWVAGAAALGVGPLGVLPDRQRAGVGSALVHALLGAAQALEEPLVALLGDPGYYARFGFGPAARLGVIAPDPAWGAAFQALRLADGAPRGRFRYAEPFDRLA